MGSRKRKSVYDKDGMMAGITPYLIVKGCKKAIAFYKKAFGAEEEFRITNTDGTIGHANLMVAGGVFMLADEHPDFGALSPATIGGTPVKLHINVKNVDAVVARARKAGATVLRPVRDQLHGERSGMIADPFGHQWFIGTPIKNVSPREMQALYEGRK
jgi:PhnB protein